MNKLMPKHFKVWMTQEEIEKLSNLILNFFQRIGKADTNLFYETNVTFITNTNKNNTIMKINGQSHHEHRSKFPFEILADAI